MGWADRYIAQLQAGMTVSFRPRGNSMTGLIESGQLVTVEPLVLKDLNWIGRVVLCKVSGHQYLHKVTAQNQGRFQIGNNKGHINGWTLAKNVYGLVTKVEP